MWVSDHFSKIWKSIEQCHNSRKSRIKTSVHNYSKLKFLYGYWSKFWEEVARFCFCHKFFLISWKLYIVKLAKLASVAGTTGLQYKALVIPSSLTRSETATNLPWRLSGRVFFIHTIKGNCKSSLCLSTSWQIFSRIPNPTLRKLKIEYKEGRKKNFNAASHMSSINRVGRFHFTT